MPTARAALGVTSGLDARIYAIGGRHPVADTVEAYDPSTNMWAARAPMPTPRDSLAVVTANDGTIYAIGGEDTVTGTLFNTVEAYDPATDTWAAKASMPTPRQGLAAVVGLDGRIYAVGGFTGSPPAGPFMSVGTNEVYNPATNTWTAAAAMPTPRHGFGGSPGIRRQDLRDRRVRRDAGEHCGDV
jgi:N-acetylneuraminic acid mutarotase